MFGADLQTSSFFGCLGLNAPVSRLNPLRAIAPVIIPCENGFRPTVPFTDAHSTVTSCVVLTSPRSVPASPSTALGHD